MDLTRRSLIAGCALLPARALAARKKEKEEEEEIGPVEDLMREHGILRRVLGVYDEVVRRIAAGETVPPEPLVHATEIVARFVQDYHEHNEEEWLFPRFERARRLVGLVQVLRDQHQVGRRLNADIARLAKQPAEKTRLAAFLGDYARMYRAHAAREDTVLFPLLRKLLGPRDFAQLGERFEADEHQRFGGEGFEHYLAEVSSVERAFGVEDLAHFTPEVS
jgi:hemerythrin-like domain-containing protein